MILTDLFPNNTEKLKGHFNLFRASALREAGCEVKIIAPVGITPPERFFFPIPLIGSALYHIKSKLRIPPVEIIDGFEVIHPKWFWLPRKFFWKYELELLHLSTGRKIAKVLRDFNPDAIITSWLHPFGAYAKYIKQIHNAPVLSIAEGSDIFVNPYKYKGWTDIKKYINEWCNKVICISKKMYDAAEQENIKSPKTVRNAYSQRTFFFKQPAPANDNNVQILSVGSLDIVKGHDILLKAMLKLKERFKLTLIGNGPLLEKYMQFVSSNRLGDRVAFLKEIENQYLGDYIRRSHLFCMPSRSEGFGLSALEALACGVPVIGSNVGGLAEMVIDGFNGYLFNPGRCGRPRQEAVHGVGKGLGRGENRAMGKRPL